jgi:hypothetical protein
MWVRRAYGGLQDTRSLNARKSEFLPGEGHLVGACPCDVICPCNYAQPSTHGTCDTTIVLQFDEGRYGQT